VVVEAAAEVSAAAGWEAVMAAEREEEG